MTSFTYSDTVRRQGTITTVRPAGHPVSVADAKRQLRIEDADTDQDESLAALCAAAHRSIENQLGYPILRQTRQTHLFGFPCGVIWLGAGDALGVASVKYYDSDGGEQTLAATVYIVDAVSRPATLHLAPAKSWPATQERPGSVVIEWTAGWALASDVPEDLIHAMKLLIGHWDQNREAVVIGVVSTEVQMSIDWLLQAHRINFFA